MGSNLVCFVHEGTPEQILLLNPSNTNVLISSHLLAPWATLFRPFGAKAFFFTF